MVSFLPQKCTYVAEKKGDFVRWLHVVDKLYESSQARQGRERTRKMYFLVPGGCLLAWVTIDDAMYVASTPKRAAVFACSRFVLVSKV